MKTKIILSSLASILIICLAAGAYWWMSRPQVITMDNGDKLTLLAVDYGKRHAPPAGAKKPAANAARGVRANSFTTPDDTLVVWIRRDYKNNQYPNYQFYLYDKAGTACVGSSGMNPGYNGGQAQKGSSVMWVRFDAFPRRQGKCVVRIQEYVPNAGQMFADEKFVVSNPARRSFPKWTAEPLPVTKTDDDLSVTLTKLVSGSDSTSRRDQDNPDDAINKGVQAVFNVSQNGKPVTNWQPVSIDTSDATGNHVNGWCNSQWQDNVLTTTYQFGLWPDEPAWKVRAEFSQQSDFAANELWTVQNIPLQPGRQQDFWNFGNNNNRRNTNSVFAETDLNGFHLKIFPATQFTDLNYGNGQVGGGLHIQATPSLPAGMRLTLVKLTDDQGQDLQNYNSGTSGNGDSTTYGYQMQNITGATNLNLTIALHKSRFVEFTAKPAKPESSDKN
jgi:hypothetical protein